MSDSRSRHRALGVGLALFGFGLCVTGPTGLLLGLPVVFTGFALVSTGHWLIRGVVAAALTMLVAALSVFLMLGRSV